MVLMSKKHLFLIGGAAISTTILIVIVVLAMSKPDTFMVERAIDIDAPTSKIFPFLNDLDRFFQWSPFETIDPDMQRTFTGPKAGVGARYAWSGDSQIGKGSMEIARVEPDKAVAINLHFITPFEANNVATFTLSPGANPGQTHVVWGMSGPNPFPAKIMQVFISVDTCCGQLFEDGLKKLKTLAEK